MHNDIFTIGKITIHGYGLLIAIGFLIAIAISYYRLKKNNMNPEIAFDFGLICMFGGFLGAKILYVIVEFKQFLQNPLSVLGSAGFVVYGGIIAVIIFFIIYCRIKKIDLFETADIFMPQVSIAQAFGRVGCFLAGCCYGAETTSPIGIVFPYGSIAPAGVKLWPTQLMSAGGNLIIAAILFAVSYLAYKKKAKGIVLSSYLILYGVGRFTIEFFRNDARGSVGALSTSQFISIFIVIGGVGLLIYRINSTKKQKLNN